MLCYRCSGTGKYLGNGMIMTNCEICDDGHIKNNDDKNNINNKKNIELKNIDRRSSSYKKAIDEIMKTNKKLSRDEAIKIFDTTFEKV